MGMGMGLGLGMGMGMGRGEMANGAERDVASGKEEMWQREIGE